MSDYRSNKTNAEIDAILNSATPKGEVGDAPNALTLQGARSYAEVLSKASLICAGRITALYTTEWATIGAEVEIYDAFKVKYGDNAPTITKVILVDKRVSEGIGVSTTRFLYSGDYEGCYFVMGDFEGNDSIFGLGATKGDWIIAQNLRWAKIVTKQREIAGIEGEVTANKLAQRLSTPSEDNTSPLATVQDLESKTDIVASQIFLDLHTTYDDFQVFSHKRGCEEHNRKVCQRLIENCFTDKAPNNEMFFVTINGTRDRVPYMETAILESQASDVVRASFVKGGYGRENSIAASIGVLSIDAENLRSYAESGEDTFNWKYTSIQVPSIDAIGSEGESDVYVTEFTFEQIIPNGIAVTVSPELVSAIYNKRIIVIPGKSGNCIATNTFSSPLDSPVNIRMQISTGVSIYDVLLSAIGPAPQTVPTNVIVTRLLSGTLNTINGSSLIGGMDMKLVSSISLNGKTYTPTKGAVDLGTIEGGGGNVSFIDNNSLQGLPFGYIGGYYRSYEFDGTSNAEVNLGYIDNYYYDTIAIAYDDRLFEEKIRDLKGDGKLLGTVIVRVDDSYNLYVKPVTPKRTTFGWRIFTDKTLMPDSWVDLENYYTKSEVDDNKQDKLTLTVKDNGNIVIGGIAGQSKEFMPATPSGDPMHDVYLSYYGVTYDDATGLYSLGYLNNLTAEDMRKAFRTYGGGTMSIAYNSWVNSWSKYTTIKGELPRTTLPSHTNGTRYFFDNIHFAFAWNALEQIYIGLGGDNQADMINVWQYNTADSIFVFSGMENLKYIVDPFYCNYTHNLTIFNTLPKLEEVRLYRLGGNVTFAAAKNLSLETILYAINNCASGVSFTMILNSNAYNKCIEGGEWYSEVKNALDGASTNKNTIITIASA